MLTLILPCCLLREANISIDDCLGVSTPIFPFQDIDTQLSAHSIYTYYVLMRHECTEHLFMPRPVSRAREALSN